MTVRRLSPLAVRLTAAFLTVALAALTVLVVLLLAATRAEVQSLVEAQHANAARSAAAAAAAAYASTGSWDRTDLTGAVALAAQGQASLAVTDRDGTVVAAASDQAARMMAEMHGVEVIDVPRAEPVSAAVTVDGERVGAVHLAFPRDGLPAAERQVRDSLWRVVLLGAALATVVAVAVAIFVARRVTGPVVALTEAAARLERGDRRARADLHEAPGELGQLASAFDRMAAAVQREDELRRRLVADVAHEVRTPLTILRGTTEALVDGVLQPDLGTLTSLHDEVLRLSELVGDLETLAAADAAALALDLRPVDLADVAATVVSVARPTAAEAGITLVEVLEPARARADPRRLSQVVTNLVANAIAYGGVGGTVTVTTGTRDGHAVLEVTDTGPGLSDEDLVRVFDRFYRGTAAAGTSGSGIGLSVARELVAAHGGHLGAAAAAPTGAAFTLRLPSLVDP